MLKRILSISGKQGLFRLVNQGKNMLIVESLLNGKRTPAYAHDKIISLGDIAIYTVENDVPLADVFEAVKEINEGKHVDVKALGDDEAVRAYFKEILPDFDEERVYTTDIKKVFNWYNQLLDAGFTTFKEETAEKPAEDKAE
ncbi:MAG: DUF5606 domain-containing protein [Bacteroidales bacterium]|nr:DUF5606 domain-containing protein [Bacteroidales bacterium]